MVVNEVRGEKVDIVPYTDDPAEFVMKALAPARVREVRIHPDTGTAEVIVPDFQLSLAIGKEGQNARLAARLSGWRVDIKSESQLAEEESGGGVEYAEGEWVENPSGELVWQPAEGGETISAAEAGYAAPGRPRRGRRRQARRRRRGPPMDPTSLGDKPDRPHRPAPVRPAPAAHRSPKPRARWTAAPRGGRRRHHPSPTPTEAAGDHRRPKKTEEKEGTGQLHGRTERSCVGCGRKAAPEELDRIARRPDGSLGVGRREPGRGAWICSGSTACFDQAVRRKALERSFRSPVTNTEIERLRARLYGAAPHGAQERPPTGAGEQ